MDWFIESAEGELLAMDLTKEQAVEMARQLVEIRGEPMSLQNIKTSEEVVYMPGGEIEHHE